MCVYIYCLQISVCNLQLQHSSIPTSHISRLIGHMWPVATILGRMGIFHIKDCHIFMSHWQWLCILYVWITPLPGKNDLSIWIYSVITNSKDKVESNIPSLLKLLKYDYLPSSWVPFAVSVLIPFILPLKRLSYLSFTYVPTLQPGPFLIAPLKLWSDLKLLKLRHASSWEYNAMGSAHETPQ